MIGLENGKCLGAGDASVVGALRSLDSSRDLRGY